MPGKNNELVELEQELVTSTDKALLVESDFNRKVWVTKSICTSFDILPPRKSLGFTTNTVRFKLPYWIAKKEGLI